jgi:hypothetical protein
MGWPVVRPSIVERRCWYSVRCAGRPPSAQLEDKIAGVINLFDTERHGLRAISMGLDQRVPTGALIAVVATRTCSVPGADTALTED